MTLLDDIFAPDHFLGICDECQQAKTFTTERARDLWERHHPHQEDAA